jgi:uncharacterized phage protein (predicted DNA packaging)
MIVTLEELKVHLRVVTDEEDMLLISLIVQAQEAATDFTRVDWDDMEKVPETVRLAVLLMASHFYEYRDSSDKNAYSTMLSAFHMLLYPNRKPEAMF